MSEKQKEKKPKLASKRKAQKPFINKEIDIDQLRKDYAKYQL